jgi:MFS transporter, DHA1 family, multidrug resistance protein
MAESEPTQPPGELSEKLRHRGLMTTMVVMFLMNAGFFLIIPLLSVHYVGRLGWAAAFIGLVLAVRQLLQQGLTLFGGALADRFGAKGLIMLGILIRVVSFVVMGLAITPSLLMLSGVLAAVGGALFDAPQQAVIPALARPERLPLFYARNGALQNLGRILGPLLGALLIRFDFYMVGIGAAAVFALAFVVTWLFLPAVNVSIKKQKVTTGLKLVFHDRAFITYTALLMGYWFMWVQMSISMPLVAKQLTGSDSSVAWLFTMNSTLAIVLQLPALRLAQRFFSPLPTVIIGVLLMSLGLGGVVWVNSMLQLVVPIFFFALGMVLVAPNSQTVAATMCNPAARGAYFGFNGLALACGGGLGHIIGGTLVDWAAAMNWPALPWLVFATVGVLTAIGLLSFYRQQPGAVCPAPLSLQARRSGV